MLRKWLRRGKRPAKILALLVVPYLPLSSFAFLGGAPRGIFIDESSTGHGVSSMGPAGDFAPDGPPTLFAPAEIRARSRGWKVRRLGETGWRLLAGGRCDVSGDVGLTELRTACVHAEAFVGTIEGALGGWPAGSRLAVRVFRNRNAFDVYASVAGAKGADSFYDPRAAEAVIWWPEDGLPSAASQRNSATEGTAKEGRRWRLLMHELAHACLDQFFGRREPLWLAEGIADYFMNFQVAPDGVALEGGPDPAAAARLAEALGNGTFVPLSRLLSAGRDEFYGPARDPYYAEAWSLVRFLAADGGRPGALRDLVRGASLESLWDLRDLERRWLESIRKSET